MKLDPKAMRYLTSEDFRVLAAVSELLQPRAHDFDLIPDN
jgi:RIO-like serine/threonine protein kinase